MAISDLTEAIALEPTYIAAYHQRANIYRQLKNFPYAIRDYTKAIELSEGFSKKRFSTFTSSTITLYIFRAKAYADKGDFDQAIMDHDTAIRLRPNEGIYYSSRAETYDKMGETEKAAADRRMVESLKKKP